MFKGTYADWSRKLEAKQDKLRARMVKEKKLTNRPRYPKCEICGSKYKVVSKKPVSGGSCPSCLALPDPRDMDLIRNLGKIKHRQVDRGKLIRRGPDYGVSWMCG